MHVSLPGYLLLFPSVVCFFVCFGLVWFGLGFLLNYFFFPTNMSIHPSSLGGQPLLVVAAGGLGLAMGQGWAAPNFASALPGSLVASVRCNTPCRQVKPHGTMLEDSEGVKGARSDVA